MCERDDYSIVPETDDICRACRGRPVASDSNLCHHCTGDKQEYASYMGDVIAFGGDEE